MRSDAISISDVWSEGIRLTGGFYLSEDHRAVSRLNHLSRQCGELRDLCTQDGLFRGPIFRRIFAAGPEFGERYASAGDLLKAEVLPAGYLSALHGSLLEVLRLEEGMILVTCSGMNLGSAVWCRADMSGIVASHDLIRIRPDHEKVPAGFLYAFLSGRYGRAWNRKQIYGGSIKHVEPQHIASIPVPRFGSGIEEKVHTFVIDAATVLTERVRLLGEATQRLLRAVGLEDTPDYRWQEDRRALGWKEQNISSESLRARNYDPRAMQLRSILESGWHDPLGSLCDPSHFRGKIIFTRIDADPEHGIMLVGQRKAFRLRPDGRWISRSSIQGLGLQVPAGTVLIPSHGTLGENELYCQALIVTEGSSRYAYSGDFFRCVPLREKIRPGYLFAFLRSRIAFRLLRSISSGGKQQEQHQQMMWRFPIPRLDDHLEEEIADLVDEACRLYDRGITADQQARRIVEQAIEEAT